MFTRLSVPECNVNSCGPGSQKQQKQMADSSGKDIQGQIVKPLLHSSAWNHFGFCRDGGNAVHCLQDM